MIQVVSLLKSDMKGGHRFLERYFCDFGERIPKDQNGLAKIDSFTQRSFADKRRLLSYSRVGIVGESGIGKTEFVRSIAEKAPHVKLIRVSDYSGGGFGEGLKSVCKSTKKKVEVVIVDGVDANLPILPELVKTMEDFSKLAFIITTTDYANLDYLASNVPGFKKFVMAPLRESDIQIIAEERLGGDEADRFFKVVKNSYLPICRTPLGINLLCGYWRSRGALSTLKSQLLREFVFDLCVRNPNGKVPVSDSRSSAQYHDCAVKIAGAMFLTGKRIVTRSGAGGSPSTCLAISDFLSDADVKVGAELLRYAIFSPDESGGYAFSHKTYFDFLAAEWLFRFVPRRDHMKFFVDGATRTLFPQNVDVAAVLALRQEKVYALLLKLRPEALMTYAEELTVKQKNALFERLFSQSSKSSIRVPGVFSHLGYLDTAFSRKQVKFYLSKYRSRDPKELEFLLVACRKFDLQAEIASLSEIVIDPNVGVDERIYALTLMPHDIDKLTLNNLVDLLGRSASPDVIAELDFKARLILRLDEWGASISNILAGLVSLSGLDARRTFVRTLHMLRVKFPQMLDRRNLSDDEFVELLQFSQACLTCEVCAHQLHVMGAAAFQHCWTSAVRRRKVEDLMRSYVQIVRSGENPLRFHNRQGDEGSCLSAAKLIADEETRHAMVDSIVGNPDWRDSDVTLIMVKTLLTGVNDACWLQLRHSSALDLNMQERWALLRRKFERVQGSTGSSRLGRIVRTPTRGLILKQAMATTKAKRNRFPLVVDKICSGEPSDSAIGIRQMFESLSGCDPDDFEQFVRIADKYLNASLRKKDWSSEAPYVFCSLALTLGQNSAIVTGWTDDQLKCLVGAMLDRGWPGRLPEFSSVLVEQDCRLRLFFIDNIAEHWDAMDAYRRDLEVRTLAAKMSRTTVESFYRKLKKGCYRDEFAEAVVSALLNAGVDSQDLQNLKVVCGFIEEKVFEKGGGLLPAGDLYYYCLMQLAPIEMIKRIEQQESRSTGFSQELLGRFCDRPLFIKPALDRLGCSELATIYEFLKEKCPEHKSDMQNVCLSLLNLRDERANLLLEQFAQQNPDGVGWEKILNLVAERRAWEKFVPVPRAEIMDEMRRYSMPMKKTVLNVKILENPIQKLYWLVLAALVPILIKFAFDYFKGDEPAPNDSNSIQNVGNQRLDQSVHENKSENYDFRGATINGPVSIQRDGK